MKDFKGKVMIITGAAHALVGLLPKKGQNAG